MVEGMSQREHPPIIGGVPEHIRIAGLAFECDNGIAWVDFECMTVVDAVCDALNLAEISRGV